ncbi:MAG: glycogen synthase GlgA [Calditrichaceae bacterium]|nr:glycogen synthase GlgA [Calditrichaceae bacterium]
MKSFRICFVSSEVTPFAKTGGLADVSGSLGKYLSNAGHDLRIIMPLYSAMDTTKYKVQPVENAQDIKIWFGDIEVVYSMFTLKLPNSNADVYLIHSPHYYNRWSLYTNDQDEYLRFAILNRVAIEFCQLMDWTPDIFHCNDWQTGLIPLYLKTVYSWDKLFRKTKTVMTIHNIGYQGHFSADIINKLGLERYYNWLDANELYQGKINYLRCGVLHADKITTVSETYAKEILTDFYGEGLQNTLMARKSDLVGILNGVDYDEWNPETDNNIPFNYSVNDLTGKTKNKKKLLSQLGLAYSAKAPVIGLITRLADQKGIELFKGAIEKILAEFNIRFIVLGSGEHSYEQYLYYLQQTFSNKVVFYLGYNFELSHLIEAGSDMFVMPSKYEPCGLNQIYSLKYGTVPIVRKTGGLADTVEFYNWETQEGTGFVFDHYNADSLYWALQHAIQTFADQKAWKKLMIRGMQKDFSWDKQIPKYLKLYENLTMHRRIVLS